MIKLKQLKNFYMNRNSITCFHPSIKKAMYFYLAVNVLTVLISFYFTRYEFHYHVFTLLLFDLMLVFYIFYKKKLVAVCLNKHSLELTLEHYRFLMKNKIYEYRLNDLKFKYSVRQLSRGMKGKVLNIFDPENNIIVSISPALLLWEESEIEKLVKNIKECKVEELET